jgi:hypothetical protein
LELFPDETLGGVPAKVQRPLMERIAAVRAKLFAAVACKDKDAIARHTNEEVLSRMRSTALYNRRCAAA